MENNNVAGVWYYENNGERLGPFSEWEMQKLAKESSIFSDTPVWKEGFSNWLLLEQTSLKNYLDKSLPPPLSGEHIDNTIVWILAFAPLIGLFFADSTSWMVTFFIPFILNTALSYFDEQKLEKAGISTDKFKGFVWLVPVYLFQRAKVLKHSYAYFIVWCICFGLMIL